MPVRQKTWVALLGEDCHDCKVEGRMIVRFVGWGQYKLVWSFDTEAEAHAALEHWRREVAAAERVSSRVGA